MRAGVLTEIIGVYKPTVRSNEFGEQIQRYILDNETRAQVMHNSGSRSVTNNEVVFDYTKTFKVRRYVELCENFQIAYQNKRYRILSIEDDRKYNQKTIIAELINE